MPIDLAGPRVWRPGQGVFDGPAQQRRARLSGRWQQETIRDRAGAGLPGGWVVRGRVRRPRSRQAEDGIARSRFRARLNWYSQGQPLGRCRVRRRAERVSRLARE